MNKFDVSKLALIFIKCYFWKKKYPFSYNTNVHIEKQVHTILQWCSVNLKPHYFAHLSKWWQTATTVVYTFSRWTVCDILDWSSQRSRKFHHTYWWSFFDVLYCTVAVDEFTPKSILFNWCPLKLGFTWVWKKLKCWKNVCLNLKDESPKHELKHFILFFDTLSKGAFKKVRKYVANSQLKKPSILLTIVAQCTWSFDLQFVNAKSFHVNFLFFVMYQNVRQQVTLRGTWCLK